MRVKHFSVAYIVYSYATPYISNIISFFKTTLVRDEGVGVGLSADVMASGTGVRCEVQMKMTVVLLHRPDSFTPQASSL